MMVECTANPRNHNERSIGKEFEKKERKKLYRNPISPKLNIKSKVIRALHDDLLTCYFSTFFLFWTWRLTVERLFRISHRLWPSLNVLNWGFDTLFKNLFGRFMGQIKNRFLLECDGEVFCFWMCGGLETVGIFFGWELGQISWFSRK